jgi:hypothetical protein
MKRPDRTGTPVRVTSATSMTPREVEASTRLPALVASISYFSTPLPESTTISTRSPLMDRSVLLGADGLASRRRPNAEAMAADGTELVMGPGDVFAIPPGHDSWVVGDEPYVSLHLLGASDYAAR